MVSRRITRLRFTREWTVINESPTRNFLVNGHERFLKENNKFNLSENVIELYIWRATKALRAEVDRCHPMFMRKHSWMPVWGLNLVGLQVDEIQGARIWDNVIQRCSNCDECHMLRWYFLKSTTLLSGHPCFGPPFYTKNRFFGLLISLSKHNII